MKGKTLGSISLALFLGVLLSPSDAEARRGGGGGGRSKRSSSYYKPTVTRSAVATGAVVATGAAVAANSANRSTGYRATANVNVRAEPASNAKILGKITKGTRISIENSSYPNFYQINYKNQTGFVSKRYVK